MEINHAGTIAFANSNEATRSRKAMEIAEDKEIQDITRKVIKIKIKRQGALQTMSDIYHCPPGTSLHDLLVEYDKLTEEEELGTKLSSHETVALWCTLSPEPESCTHTDLLKTMQQISEKKGINIITWSIEQSGTEQADNIGYHPHAHFLILLDKTVQQGERKKMKNTVERICKKYKTKSDVYLQIRMSSMKAYNKHLRYVKGDKDDKTKHAQVNADNIWRNKHGMQKYYMQPDNIPTD